MKTTLPSVCRGRGEAHSTTRCAYVGGLVCGVGAFLYRFRTNIRVGQPPIAMGNTIAGLGKGPRDMGNTGLRRRKSSGTRSRNDLTSHLSG